MLSIWEQVTADYAAIAFDRPGYGYSERPVAAPVTLALNARLLHGALTQLGVQRPILVGHSSGASVALRYALDYPDAVAGLVLIAPSAYAEELSVPPLAAFTDPAARAKRHAELTDELKREHAAVEAAGKFIYDNVIDPADTREMLLRTLRTLAPAVVRSERKRVIEPF